MITPKTLFIPTNEIMKTKKKNNYFFLISFLPALAYWYLEEKGDIQVAVIGGIILSIMEIIIEKIFTKHIHSLSKLNFALMVILGPLSIFEEEGFWFKLTPTFTGLFLGFYLLYFSCKNKGILYELLKTSSSTIPPWSVFKNLEIHLSFFFIFYALFMGIMAISGTTGQWAFFKTIGLYIAFIPFLLFEFFFLRKKTIQLVQKDRTNQGFSKISEESVEEDKKS